MNVNVHPAVKQAFSIWIISEQIFKNLNIQDLASLCVVIEIFAALPRDSLLKKYRIINEMDIFYHTVIRVTKTISRLSH